MTAHGSCGGQIVWVTGAAGFLGQAVCREIQRSHPADRLVRLGRGLPHDSGAGPGSRGASGPFTTAGFDAALRSTGAGPDIVFHLAAGASVGQSLADPRKDFRDTVDGASAFLRWLGQNAPEAKVVLASSAAVYGANHGPGLREDAARCPTSPYGWHKSMVEDLARSEAQISGLRCLAVRIFSVYGAGLQKQLFWDLARKVAAGDPQIALMGTGAELRDWCHVDEVARVLVALAHQPALFTAPMRPVNLGSGRGVTVGEAVRTFLKHWAPDLGFKPALRFSGLRAPGDPASLVADITRLQSTGLRAPHPFPFRFDETVAWYRRLHHVPPYRIHLAARTPLVGRARLPVQSGQRLS